jgi:hypothetical protein
MKITTCLSIVLISAGSLGSCKKNDEVSTENKQKADEFKAAIVSQQFQVRDYYSDKPIDYIEDDQEVKEETQLFSYVSPWIKDDLNVFDAASKKVTITQNAVKIPGDASETLVKDFNIGADKDGVYFDFLNYQYQPLRYRLVEFTNTHFIVYTDWKSGAKVFTRFEVVTE